MLNATMIVPVGVFTSDLARRVRETAFRTAQQREVVISLQSTGSFAWSALNELAESLHAAATPYPIRLTRAVPRARALLHELGIENRWFVGDGDFRAAAKIVIARPGQLSRRTPEFRRPPRRRRLRRASHAGLPWR